MSDIRRKAEEIMKRGDEMIIKQKRRRTILLRSLAVGAGAAAVLGVGLTTFALRPPKKPTPSQSDIIVETETTSAETTVTLTSPSTTAPQTATTERRTTAATAAATSSARSTTTTVLTIVTSAHTMKTTALQETKSASTQTTTIIQGGINMKMISAFIATLLMTTAVTPPYAYAEQPQIGHTIMFNQSELSTFKEYEQNGVIGLNADINGDGSFDICDVFELRLYGERFKACFEKYGYDQTEYAELEEMYGGKSAERILECFGAEGAFSYMPVSPGGSDPHTPEGAQLLARYYLFKYGSYPADDEIRSALEGRAYFAPASDDDIEAFISYINELRGNIVYADSVPQDIVYTDEQLAAFARFDSGTTDSDINGDGISDFNDGFDVLIYSMLKNDMGQTSDNNLYLSEAAWQRIESCGDVSLDGIVDRKDYDILVSYYYRNTIMPTKLNDAMIERILFHINEKSANTVDPDTAHIMKAYIAENDYISRGDANCDGKATVADSVAILQHIANRDKYGLMPQGLLNADVDGVAGVTANDARVLQEWDANK